MMKPLIKRSSKRISTKRRNFFPEEMTIFEKGSKTENSSVASFETGPILYKEKNFLFRLCCCFVALLFYVHGKHLRSCWDGQLT